MKCKWLSHQVFGSHTSLKIATAIRALITALACQAVSKQVFYLVTYSVYSKLQRL